MVYGWNKKKELEKFDLKMDEINKIIKKALVRKRGDYTTCIATYYLWLLRVLFSGNYLPGYPNVFSCGYPGG